MTEPEPIRFADLMALERACRQSYRPNLSNRNHFLISAPAIQIQPCEATLYVGVAPPSMQRLCGYGGVFNWGYYHQLPGEIVPEGEIEGMPRFMPIPTDN
jgi:hypothetical protein